MAKATNKSGPLGQWAEDYALGYLQRQGLMCVERNFLCRQGEIDLIMHDRKHLVFVEVRARCSSSYGSPIESITWFKRQKIVKAAHFYLKFCFKSSAALPILSDQPVCRFDAVGIVLDEADSNKARVKECVWMKGAFEDTTYFT